MCQIDYYWRVTIGTNVSNRLLLRVTIGTNVSNRLLLRVTMEQLCQIDNY